METLAMRMMMTSSSNRAFPIGARWYFGTLYTVLWIYWITTENLSAAAVAGSTEHETAGIPETLLRPPVPHGKRRPTDASKDVPSVDIDCALRHLALEFAMQKLPWSGTVQRRSISDALRLHECPKKNNNNNNNNNSSASSSTQQQESATETKPKTNTHSDATVTRNPPTGMESSDHERISMAQIRRSRRARESSNNTQDPEQQQQQESTGNANGNNCRNPEDHDATIVLFVDPNRGNDEASGTCAHPLETIPAALEMARRRRGSFPKDSATNVKPVCILLRGGTYPLEEPLRLDSRDRNLTLRAYPEETPVLSGGDPLSLRLSPTPEHPAVYAATLPPRKRGRPDHTYNFTMLFLDRSQAVQEEATTHHNTNTTHGIHHHPDVRLVWAREPNGHPERDLQPDGYATANGTSAPSWPPPDGAIHWVVGQTPGGARNSTVYPWHGEDRDPRGGGHWLHFGGAGRRFADRKGYWNGSVPLGLTFHGRDLNTTHWTPQGLAAPAIAHVFHNAFWGNWQFEVDSVTTTTTTDEDSSRGDGSEKEPNETSSQPQNEQQHTSTPPPSPHGTISFKRGGWQEGRGGGIGHQPFFVEGVKEALDVPGEWWLDVPNQVLYYYPFGNETRPTPGSKNTFPNDNDIQIDFVAPRLQTLIEVVGETSNDRTANGIRIIGLTFAHTATTFMEPYEVPSPGDWSIHRGGALVLENAHDTAIRECWFLRTGGNAVMVSGHAKRTTIARNEFAWIGDSAIATLGKLSLADGFTVDTYPEDTLIQSNHFHEIGIHGKQTSALFSALSCRTTFVENVLYNGPRAGVNLNDQFCHGHTIRDNLLFNWVRETQDHGPINTWDRALYIQKGDSGAAPNNPTRIPQWTHIERNFIMNGPSGNRDLGNLFPTIDNDDGSSYFYIAKNLLVYGGGKNYLGHDKLWISNLLVYPGRWSGEGCAQIWGGKNHYFADNTCLVAPGDPPIGLDGSMKGFACKIDWEDPENNLAFVGKTANNSYYLDQNDQWGFGCGNGTSPSHWFALEELQKHGWELGSTVRDSNLLTADRIVEMAKNLFAMDGRNRVGERKRR